MNDPVVEQLRQALAAHGAGLLQDRARVEQQLAPVATSFPGKVKALLILLDKNAVSFLAGWAKDTRPGRASFEQVRQQVATKFEHANVLNAPAAAWAFEAWAAALNVRPAAAASLAAAARAAVPGGGNPAAVAAPSSPGGAGPALGLAVATAPAAAVAGAVTSPRPLAAEPQAHANVYAPPAAHVEDPQRADEDDTFVPRGRSVSAGAGWRWFAEGFRLFRQSPLIWIVNAVLFMVIAVGVQLVPFLGAIAGSLLAAVLTGGLMLGAHAAHYGDSLEVGHLFAGFRERAGALVLVGLLYLVGVFVIVFGTFMVLGAGVGLASVLGSGARGIGVGAILGILVALALILPLAMAYWFAPALVAINGESAVEGMKSSFFGCMKNIVPFIVYGLVVVVAAVVATLPLGLGWFVLAPVLFASMYASYRDIYYAA